MQPAELSVRNSVHRSPQPFSSSRSCRTTQTLIGKWTGKGGGGGGVSQSGLEYKHTSSDRQASGWLVSSWILTSRQPHWRIPGRITHLILFGKIQGDGRKFLDRFKSYFGSQISSQSFMRSISTEYSLNPQQKVIFFHHIFLSLIV